MSRGNREDDASRSERHLRDEKWWRYDQETAVDCEARRHINNETACFDAAHVVVGRCGTPRREREHVKHDK